MQKNSKDSFNRANLYYEVRPKTNDVDKELIKFIKKNEGKSGIVYCLSRKKVEELSAILQANNIKARTLSRRIRQYSKIANTRRFPYGTY